jgi:hypothetical protein
MMDLIVRGFFGAEEESAGALSSRFHNAAASSSGFWSSKSLLRRKISGKSRLALGDSIC